MPVWKMSGDDYARIKASERHHFIHENATSRTADGCHHMTFSRNVAAMLRAELGVELAEIHKVDHPCDAEIMPLHELRATALNAPGFNARELPPPADPAGEVADGAQ